MASPHKEIFNFVSLTDYDFKNLTLYHIERGEVPPRCPNRELWLYFKNIIEATPENPLKENFMICEKFKYNQAKVIKITRSLIELAGQTSRKINKVRILTMIYKFVFENSKILEVGHRFRNALRSKVQEIGDDYDIVNQLGRKHIFTEILKVLDERFSGDPSPSPPTPSPPLSIRPKPSNKEKKFGDVQRKLNF